MKRIVSRHAVILGVLGLLTGSVAALDACSSSSGNNGGFGGDSGSSNDDGAANAACTSMDALQIIFSPMYSAYIPGDSTQVFQIPAVVNGMDNTGITWTASPASAVTFAADTTTGGTMITMAAAPASPVTITANASGQCGTSQLTITPATMAQWSAGSARYNSNTPLLPQCVFFHGGQGFGGGGGMHDGGFPMHDGGGFGGFTCPDAGPACTQCHGPTANAMFGFQDIAHTPQQTGGFSDTDMINIITQGQVPGCGTSGTCEDGGYFDPTIFPTNDAGLIAGQTPYEFWHSFHQWDDIQGSDQESMVIYLRSLTPTSQGGTSDFGGHYDGGGHHHDGGYHHDGGGGPPPPANDSGTTPPESDAAGD